jgi:tetratricopeptide (TPR) repeat protein
MTSGEETNGEQEKELQKFEAKMKSLVDGGKYAEAIKFSQKNIKILSHYHGDSCTLYSYKIMGVCYLNDIRNSWNEKGYKPSQLMAEGDRLFDKGDYDGAVTAYGKAQETDSDKALYAMGCAYRAMGNPYESVDAWDEDMAFMNKDVNAKKLENNPNDAKLWAERGNFEYTGEHWGPAISSYNNSLAIDPGQPEIWFRKGCSHFEDDEFLDALTAFKKVLELQPDHLYAANDAAVVLCKLGRHAEVMQFLDQSASHCPPGSLQDSMVRRNKETAASQDWKGDHLTFLS